ncbi:MAG: response regulator [Candidatus Doudnabacteria bacterium]
MFNVLFAHSDPKIVDLYHPRLAVHFSVDSAHDGLTALRKLKLAKPGLVVSDYDLPLLSGLALLKFCRRQSAYASIPFIFLADIANAQQALSSGANDWLQLSSVTPDLLIGRIYGQLKLNRYGLQINRT